MENEIWKRIPGMNYEASNLGKIRNCKTLIERKPFLHWKGYHTVGVLHEGKHKNLRVHRSVMAAFIGESELQVNHKNGIKTDNRLENLEYVTGGQNIQHSISNGFINHRKRRVIQMDENMIPIREFESHSEAARILGFDQGAISACVRGKYVSYKGFLWQNA